MSATIIDWLDRDLAARTRCMSVLERWQKEITERFMKATEARIWDSVQDAVLGSVEPIARGEWEGHAVSEEVLITKWESRTIMTAKDRIRPEGVLTFWSLAEEIGEGACSVFMAEPAAAIDGERKLALPTPRTPSAALGRACQLYASALSENKDHAIIARPMVDVKGRPARNGWVFVKEECSVSFGNRYETLAAVSLNAGNGRELDIDSSLFAAKGMEAAALRALHREQMRTVCASSMGGFLCEAAIQCGGVALRPGGGIYWIPPGEKAEKWDKLAAAVEAAYRSEMDSKEWTRKHSTVYRVRHELDEDSARGVVEEVRSKLNEEIKGISEKTFKKKPSSKQVREHNERIDRLLSSATGYEEALSASLSDLRKRLEEAREIRGVGELLAAVGD